ADINDWAQMSAEYIKFFPTHKPARSAFATTGLALNARIEIECVAYLNKTN
ncbi:MAG: RidA family protein, partial [Cyclobacteriaceae bacterium]|nr:RidA family protein [Cyclobacteriaceae bacterium]